MNAATFNHKRERAGQWAVWGYRTFRETLGRPAPTSAEERRERRHAERGFAVGVLRALRGDNLRNGGLLICAAAFTGLKQGYHAQLRHNHEELN